MKMTNGEIYNHAISLVEFEKEENFSFPTIINFYIQKNIQEIKKIGSLIEDSRSFVIKKYGKPDPKDNEQFLISPEYREKAQKELDQLLELEQDVNIYMIKLSDLSEVQINTKQLKAILFMIEDDLSETKEDN